ncbi:MAG: YggT family protein [Blastocatellia bacterium]
MLEDEKLTIDESRKIAQHEATKGAVRNEVHEEIARKANHLDATERAQTDQVAEQFKHKAVREVVDTESEIDRARGAARVSQVIDYIFYFIYGLIGLMIVLDLVGANRSNSFYRFMSAVTSPLLAPFRGLVDDPTNQQMRFRLSYIVAIIVYLLLHLAINGLLRLVAHRRTTV